jgi:hypothetical protein
LTPIGVVVPSLTSVTAEDVSVAGSISSENLAAISVLRITSVAPLRGYTSLTLGAVLSTLRVTELEAEEVLPSASMALAK